MKSAHVSLSHDAALTGVFLAAGSSLKSQVVYTDIDPDILFDPESACMVPPTDDEYYCSDFMTYMLDMNADGDDDFRIRAIYSYYAVSSGFYDYQFNAASIQRYDANRIGGGEVEDEDIVHLYAPGAMIGSSVNWFGAGFHDNLDLAFYNIENGVIHISHGEWLDSEYQFAALKIVEGINTYYGWVRLSVDEIADQLIIHDYAYNATSGASIIAGEEGNCYPPSISGVSNITPAKARLKWAPVLDAEKYQIYYRVAGVVGWTKINVSGTAKQKTLSGLACDTDYEWKIRTRCADGFSAFSAIQTFSTASCRLSDDNAGETSILVFPNPATGIVHVDLSEFEGDAVHVQVINLMGQIVFTENNITAEVLHIDISDLTTGNYIVRVSSGRSQAVQKFIIQ